MAAGGVGYFATGFFHLEYWETNYWPEVVTAPVITETPGFGGGGRDMGGTPLFFQGRKIEADGIQVVYELAVVVGDAIVTRPARTKTKALKKAEPVFATSYSVGSARVRRAFVGAVGTKVRMAHVSATVRCEVDGTERIRETALRDAVIAALMLQ